MSIFYTFLLFYIIINSTYYYNKNFKNSSELNSYISKYILSKIGYTIDENSFKNLPSKLVIISSHTSIYDFFLGILIYNAYLKQDFDIYTFMKKEFEIITSPILKILNNKFKLISVNSNSNGLVTNTYHKFKNLDNYIIYIAPEGTRKCSSKLKSGYWNISKILNIDIAYIGMDFSLKNIVLEKPRTPENDWEKEKELFIKSCNKYIPLYPERCYWLKDYY
jgi:1-acyl-sn-glycerol-3-phosphate acyltransferase